MDRESLPGVRVPPTARRRVLVALACGLVAGGIVAAVGPWQLALLTVFDVWAAVQLVWLAVAVLPLDAEQTRAAARREDTSRAATALIVNGAGLTSLIGVALALVKARQVGPAQETLLTVVGVLTVVLSWLTVHAVFTLRYADLFYGDHGGGIDFPGDDHPRYHDFAYLGFTIGMTFQVSDTDITSTEVRRVITRHSLISYVFSTVIIGLTINVMAGFLR